MSKTIAGIPESFTREQYLSIFKAIGVKPEEVRSMTLEPEGAYVEVLAQDSEGHHVISQSGGSHTHQVFVPVSVVQEVGK